MAVRRPEYQIEYCDSQPFGYTFPTMPALIIESFPEALHEKLRENAAAHHRSVTQEAIHLLEIAISAKDKTPPAAENGSPKWANRRLLPEYEAALKAGAFSGGTDSARIISEERDAR